MDRREREEEREKRKERERKEKRGRGQKGERWHSSAGNAPEPLPAYPLS
jgi:hypothetical protein